MPKQIYRTDFEKVVHKGLTRNDRTKEWLADQLKVTVQTLDNWFRGSKVKPSTRYYIGILLSIPEFTEAPSE